MTLAIGVDVGGTKVAAGVVDEDGRIIAKLKRSTPAASPARTEQAIADAVTELLASHRAAAIGLGAAGFVDSARATMLFAPNLAWRDLPIAARRALRGAVRIKLRSVGDRPLSELSLARLPLFLRGTEQLGMRLYELLAGGSVGLVARDANGKRCGFSPRSALRGMGFADDEALLSYDLRSFQGYRLLHEYFGLPQRFLFVELQELAASFKNCTTSEIERLATDRPKTGVFLGRYAVNPVNETV